MMLLAPHVGADQRPKLRRAQVSSQYDNVDPTKRHSNIFTSNEKADGRYAVGFPRMTAGPASGSVDPLGKA
jgi:hypothetical protein